MDDTRKIQSNNKPPVVQYYLFIYPSKQVVEYFCFLTCLLNLYSNVIQTTKNMTGESSSSSTTNAALNAYLGPLCQKHDKGEHITYEDLMASKQAADSSIIATKGDDSSITVRRRHATFSFFHPHEPINTHTQLPICCNNNYYYYSICIIDFVNPRSKQKKNPSKWHYAINDSTLFPHTHTRIHTESYSRITRQSIDGLQDCRQGRLAIMD